MKGMWLAHKKLLQTVTNVIVNKNFEQIAVFEDALKKNRDLFLRILQNSPKSQLDRETIKRAHKDGIQVDGQKAKHILSVPLIEEAIILSDLYNMNELLAVELLLEAETQMQYFPNLTRGLTAILLYYDSKKSIINTLKLLLLARNGRTWILDESMPNDLVKFINDYTNRLIYDGLIGNILKQVELYNWQDEQNKLLKEGGLGNAKHRKQVKSVFDEIKTGLCECIFNSACQVPLNRKDTLSLLEYLKSKVELNHKSQLNVENTYLIMAILYCFDCNCLENKQQSDIANVLNTYVNYDTPYLSEIHAELLKADTWRTPGIKALVQFTWEIYLCTLYPYLSEPIATANIKIFEDDDVLIDKAIEQRVFKFISASLISNEKFHMEV